MAPHEEEPGPVDLPVGKVISRHWKIVEKLGAGACGAVYLVENSKTHLRAALKAESNFAEGGAVLKLEVQVLRRMKGRKFVAQLISAGKKERYSYMVMTLFGPSVSKLFKECRREFSVGTQLRIGMQILYGLKQLHEVGYIHRDVKPANLAVGLKGQEARMVHMLDFGLAREYVLRVGGKVEMRRPRAVALFRGTYKYCSQNAHGRSEQGRPEDLWSLVYVLADFRGPLPWHNESDKKEIARLKTETPDEHLFRRSPPELLHITTHLRSLDYYKRPDYEFIFNVLYETMLKYKIKYADPFDWDLVRLTTSPAKNKLRRRLSRLLSITEDESVNMKTMDVPETLELKTAQEQKDAVEMPFGAADFARNELGF